MPDYPATFDPADLLPTRNMNLTAGPLLLKI